MKRSHFDLLKSGPNQAPLVFFDKVKGFLAIAPRSQIRGRKVISPKKGMFLSLYLKLFSEGGKHLQNLYQDLSLVCGFCVEAIFCDPSDFFLPKTT
jgi:hypothetical protein